MMRTRDRRSNAARTALLWLALLLALLAVGVPVVLIRATLPLTDESAHIRGLSAAVGISIDSHGIPRIRAATETDAATALGFLHARDRLFEMELMRRAASGRLAELAGPKALPLDRMARTLGERRHAERSLAALPEPVRALLAAYSAGVNAWIGAHGRFSGLEFLALGTPEPWTPVDCLLWNETVSLWLSDNFRTELSRAALRATLPMEKILQLWPSQALSTGAGPAPQIRQGLLDALPRFPAPFTLPNEASNAWAVDGRHSATGSPLLAGDPHLRLAVPSIWYLARIETPQETLVGATAPGVPFLVLGRNAHIAWSFTSSGIDTQDVFVETELPGSAYATPDGKRAFASRDEIIHVRGAPDEILHVRETRHGPVVSDLDPNPGGPVLAVEMANFDLGSAAAGIVALNHAASVAEAGRAAPLILAPVQNLTVADHDGIGLFTTGMVPIRRAGDGSAPVAGADGLHDWTGFASGEALPHVVSPSAGVVANANDRVAGPEFPVFLGRDFPAPFRARRIHALLDGRTGLDLATFGAMQADPASVFAAEMLPHIRALPPLAGTAGRAQALLSAWNGTMDAARPEPLIFNAAIQDFVRRVLQANKVAEEDSGPWSGFAAWLLTPEGRGWCGGDCGPILAEALQASADALAKLYGADPTTWRWGQAHRAIFSHPLLGDLPLIGALASRHIEIPGDDTTLFRGGSGTLGDFSARHGAAYRGLYDLGDLERSRFITIPGQSGNIFSAHAWDMLAPWARGATITIPAAPDRVAQTVRLEP